MSSRLIRRTSGPGLAERVDALATVVRIAEPRFDPGLVAPAATVVARADERLRFGSEHTVVALAGATGSGKSSLFNSLSGADLSAVGVRRPTTSTAQACVWGEADASGLLDWLDVPARHRIAADETDPLAGLVLLDLPDHDSTVTSHRLEVDRLVELVDLLVWVLDPQKYADAAVHDRYLRPLAGHVAVTVVVLNQVDLLAPDDRTRCVADLRKLLADDGMPGVPLLTTSARTGEGLGDLHSLLAERVAARRAATDRLAADVDRALAAFADLCGGRDGKRELGKDARARLTAALAAAAGADVVVEAVVAGHRRDAAGMTGWPFVTWVRKLRPDPLRRLHLERTPNEAARTSLPPASQVQRSRVTNAIAAAADSVAADLPDPWPRLARRAAGSNEELLPDLLDRAVAGATLTSGRTPLWWKVVRIVQRVLATATLAGALWLAVLFVFSYMRLPEPPTPEVSGFPLPTLLLLGGVLAGVLAAAVSRMAARRGARRRGRRAQRELDDRVGQVGEEQVIGPLKAELSAYQTLCDALRGGVQAK